jgi:hypothetical protein
MGRSFLEPSEIRGLGRDQSMPGKPATGDCSIIFKHGSKVRQAVFTELLLLCRIDIQLRWGRNLGVGRSPSTKCDRCALNVSSCHLPRSILQSQEQVSGMLCISVWRIYDIVRSLVTD